MPQNQITGTEASDYLLDSALDDEIFASDGNDEIEISAGNDIIYGDAGLDRLIVNYAMYGADLIFSLQNYDNTNYDGSLNIDLLNTQNNNLIKFYSIEILEIIGGLGFDKIAIDYSNSDEDLHIVSSAGTYGDLNIYYSENSNSDRIEFSDIEGLNITSGHGNDNIDLDYDNYSNDTVNTGAGNDYISTGKGFDLVDGGIGFDILNLDFSNSENRVTSSLDSVGKGEYIAGDTTVEFKNIEAVEILGSSYDDLLVAFASHNDLEMDSDIDGGEGIDELVVNYAHDDRDYDLTAHPRDNTLNMYDPETGEESVINFNSIESFNLTTGNGDNLISLSIGHLDGTSSNDKIDAGGGNDWIYIDKGFDLVDGGSEFDVLSISFADSTSGVNSSLNSNNSGKYISDTTTVEFENIEAVDILGSFHDDILVAIPYNDRDYPQAHAASPTIDGGNGIDRLVVDYSKDAKAASNHGIYIYNNSLLSHDPQTGEIDTLAFKNIEAFEISAGDGNNIINLGYDNFSHDIVNAGAGDDEITTGKGFDVIDGGYGYDVVTLNFNSSTSGIVSTLINAHSGEYSNKDESLSVNFTRVEAINAIGSSHDDVLSGLKGKDTIYGGLGNDTIRSGNDNDFVNGADGRDLLLGGNGNDSLYGGVGIDTIGGGSGNDLIEGNEERDILFGHNGNDTLEGGTGNDILVGGNDSDVLYGGDGKDILFGNGGMDIFVVESDVTEFDLIRDFADGVDKLGLSSGLTFDDLTIASNSAGTITFIRDATNNNRVLASIVGISSMEITDTDFISI